MKKSTYNPKHRRKRGHWLEDQVKQYGFTVGAEVGVEGGQTMRYLLLTCPGLRMYAVDVWGVVPEVLQSDLYNYADKSHDAIYRAFQRRITPFRNRVQVLRGISWEMACRVEDGELDFVFIDADHGYSAVKRDIEAWWPKVRAGGLFSGHDYNLQDASVRGVVVAVDELFGQNGFQLSEFDHVWYVWKK